MRTWASTRPQQRTRATPGTASSVFRMRSSTKNESSSLGWSTSIFQFAIEVLQPSDELSFFVDERILKTLEAVPGVARVRCWGLVDAQVRIYVNEQRALAAGVRLYELTRALEAGNVDTSGG